MRCSMNRGQRLETPPAARRSPSAAQPIAGNVLESPAPNLVLTAGSDGLLAENSSPSILKFLSHHRETLRDGLPATCKFLETASSDRVPKESSDIDPERADQSLPRNHRVPTTPLLLTRMRDAHRGKCNRKA